MEANNKQVHVDSIDEEIVARVAGIDVAKDSGMVCTRVPHSTHPGKRTTTVWSVSARTSAIIEVADWLAEEHVERVVLEATSDFWRPFYYLLEARGQVVWVVNARDVKNVPGRPRTDKLDAVWLAKLNERGMLRASFIPPIEIRQLRDYTRLRVDLTAERSRHIQRLEKPLEDALIKLSSVATNMMGVSGRAMIEARIADMPAAQAPPAAANPDDAGEPAYLAAVDRLDEITGVGRHAAQVIIAEVGLSMAIFPPPRTWCPGPSSHRAPTSPAPRLAQVRPARATPTSRACSVRPPHQPGAPTPSSAPDTAAWPGASASSRPSSPSPAPSSSSSGTYSPTPPGATAILVPSSSTTGSGPNAARSTTSANSKHSATPSPSPRLSLIHI